MSYIYKGYSVIYYLWWCAFIIQI